MEKSLYTHHLSNAGLHDPLVSIPIGFQGTGKASASLIRGASVPTGNNKTNTERGEQRSQADNTVQTLKGDGYICTRLRCSLARMPFPSHLKSDEYIY